MNVPNRYHNSGKKKKGRGTCKGRMKARKQSLEALKNRFAKKGNKGLAPPSLCLMIRG